MVQKYQNSKRQILEEDRKDREIYKRGSERSSRVTRERLEKRKEGITLEGKDICS